MGSPTEPNTLRDLRLYLVTWWSPSLIRERIAVGACWWVGGGGGAGGLNELLVYALGGWDASYRVEVGNAVFINDIPQSSHIRKARHALEDDLGGCIEERAVRHITMARDPPTCFRLVGREEEEGEKK